MKTLKASFAFIFSLSVSTTSLAGGSFVGNGAGLVENRFQYAYISLQKVLMNCLINEDCDLTPEEQKVAAGAEGVIVANINNPQKFIFVTEEQMAKVATLPISEPHRVAMTGLTPADPIYVNVHQLYDSEGQPQLDYNSILALIFHEVGHQSGVESHQLLDLIGSKLRVKFEAESLPYKFELANGEKIEITINNFSSPNKFAEIRLTRNDSSIVNLGAVIAQQLKCSRKDMQVSGYEFFNGYFSPYFNSPVSTFNLISNVYCVRATDGYLLVERKSVKFDIIEDNKIEALEVKIIRD